MRQSCIPNMPGGASSCLEELEETTTSAQKYCNMLGRPIRMNPLLRCTFEPHNKKIFYFPLHWMFNRDPYNGLLQSPHPLYPKTSPNNQFSTLLISQSDFKMITVYKWLGFVDVDKLHLLTNPMWNFMLASRKLRSSLRTWKNPSQGNITNPFRQRHGRQIGYIC